MVRPGLAGHGEARRGEVRSGEAWHGRARRGGGSSEPPNITLKGELMAITGQKSEAYRRSMLAIIHIAVSQLDISDSDYRDIIEAHAPGKRSSKQLNVNQLKNVIRYFESKGFKARGQKSEVRSQTTALKIRAKSLLDKAVADGLVNSASGLVKKICGVDELNWCKDAGKLKRLLAVLDSIEQGAQSKAQGGTYVS
jgi:phage gp16-like protein